MAFHLIDVKPKDNRTKQKHRKHKNTEIFNGHFQTCSALTIESLSNFNTTFLNREQSVQILFSLFSQYVSGTT